MIPYGRQSIDEDDIAAVAAVLRGDWLTQGPTIEAFESAIAQYTGAKHAVAYANGTAALHGATAAAALGPAHLVGTSSLSFVASANCARFVGADVTLLDIDPATLNVDPMSIGPELDALVAVHFAGLPMALDRLAHRPRVVIEDAAHALGAFTPDGPVGNCAHSDMTCFSFHPVKPVTTGEGGVVTTNDDGLAHRLRRFRNHGIERVPERGGWYYEVVELAYNYRLTDIHAALGLSQLAKLDRFVARRRQLAAQYDELLAEFAIELAPQAAPGFGHAYHLYPVRVPDRHDVYDKLRANGIAVQVHYVPIHHHPTYRELGVKLPNTDEAYAGLLSLPLFPALSDDDQRRVVATLGDALAGTTERS
jgi:UDP-4-amino-4,6-dideoxy-N-acetyl-beta-L-altrosamine transaminase